MQTSTATVENSVEISSYSLFRADVNKSAGDVEVVGRMRGSDFVNSGFLLSLMPIFSDSVTGKWGTRRQSYPKSRISSWDGPGRVLGFIQERFQERPVAE